MSGSDRRPADAVLVLHDEGAAALADQARVVDWDRPACGTWTAAEVVRHVAGVAGWYHQWLDRALLGDDAAPFPSTELAERNEQLLAARSGQDPDVALEEFVTEAERYGRRLPAHWDVAYGYPGGTVTAGLHAGAAASEWHLHAWDLARAEGRDHRPSDPSTLFRAVGQCVTTARGGLIGRTQAALVRAGGRVGPWPQLLRASGRPVGRG